jgi:hypothetical protein
MMRHRIMFLACSLALATTAMPGNALAVPTMDGTASVADDYASLSIQNTDTQFGDNSSADPIATADGGSELDQVFGKIEGDRLYMVLAGNLETNFNKLEIFIDSKAGGHNVLDGSLLPAGVDAFCCGGFGTTSGALQNMGGGVDGLGIEKVKFDTGFEADYYLTFTNGAEDIGEENVDRVSFHAASIHFSDMTLGSAKANVAVGIQLAYNGLPNVLRGPLAADFNEDFVPVDSVDLGIWKTGFGTGTTKADGDADDDGDVDGNDFLIWQQQFGSDRTLESDSYVPFDGGPSSNDLLFNPALPGLSQGELIDKNYALSVDGGCTADTTDGGAGCLARELEFALPVDTNDDPANVRNHRDFENTIDLEMAFDNSNITGVEGDGTNSGDFTIPTIKSPGDVTTGMEFSIPLSEIGDPASLSDIKITTFINNGSHDFISNQVSGVGILDENISAPGFADFSLFDGDQFVTLSVPAVAAASAVPEPSSIAMVLIMACGLFARLRA